MLPNIKPGCIVLQAFLPIQDCEIKEIEFWGSWWMVENPKYFRLKFIVIRKSTWVARSDSSVRIYRLTQECSVLSCCAIKAGSKM